MEKKDKKLTRFAGWSIGTGAMLGVTIFVISGIMIDNAGPAASISFLIGCLVTLAIALCFCELSSALPYSGGIYTYPRMLLGRRGPLLSFITGWAFFGGQGLGPAIVAMGAANYLTWLFISLGLRAPIPETMLAILIIVLIALCNIMGTSWAAKFQAVTTLVVAGTLIGFVVWGGTEVSPALYQPLAPYGWDGILKAAAVGWLAYGAWSTIPNMSEEFRNPRRDVPFSMVSSLVTSGLLFAAIVLVMAGLIPYDVIGSESAPLAVAAETFTNHAGLFIALIGIFAALSTLNGLTMTSSRIIYSMGRDGVLPKRFGQMHSSFGTPIYAVLITSAGQIILAATGLFEILVEMIVFVTAIAWLIGCICLFALRKTEYKATFKVPFYPVLPIIALVLSVFLLLQLDTKAIFVGLVWITLGLFVYWLRKANRH